MSIARGKIAELFLDGSVRIDCPSDIVPGPGEYLAAHDPNSDSTLGVSLFSSDASPTGFRADANHWTLGTTVDLRGPLGRGFILPPNARKIALIAWDDSPIRFRGLIRLALAAGAEIVLLADSSADDLPSDLEVQPLRALPEICRWAQYLAADVARENLHQLRDVLIEQSQLSLGSEAQILVRAPMPCAGIADCGACSISIGRDWKRTCREGPVFAAREIFGSS